MAKEIFIINICAIFLSTGQLKAQDWYFFEQDQGVCHVDSLNITDSRYYSLLDTIEYYWSVCDINKKPCFATVGFTNTKNRFSINVFQMVEVSPLVISCYMNKIYGCIYYHNHLYFFTFLEESMVDTNAVKKSGFTCVPDYFSSQTYRDVTSKTDFLVKSVNQEKKLSYPSNPFDEEWKNEEFDKLRLKIELSEDGVVCSELEDCIHTDAIPNTNH